MIACEPDGAQHQRRLRLDPHGVRSSSECARAATTSASRSTATATGCWRSAATGRWSTATRSSPDAALDLKRAGELTGNGVAVTVMTNYGFHQAMSDAGIEVATTDGRRPARGGRAARARLGARRRAVGPHRRHAASPVRRRDRRRAAAAARRSAAATSPSGGAMTKLPQVLRERARRRSRGARGRAAVWEAVERSRAALEGRGPRAGARRRAPSRWCA